VRGTRREDPVMRAVNEPGKELALWWSESDARRMGIAEIVLPPGQAIGTELMVMIVTATPFFAIYFLKPGH